ncbi:MAG: Fe-S cluster assembly protein SufB [candidate division Zixibacteria bacterium]|nr:Fe-S cluster assembly protein SufB [candidate division Zixibacteria bacterium]MBU1471128.1 Fe-S cluster assembly protein SufB [candidate division Zixibacteria bacterium]MBU2625641.1 Fe-S cluster assembly protein SufB [candidate division Zixibacteria bacterium]
MAEILSKNKGVETLGDDYAVKYGFKDPEEYFHKGKRGVDHEVVEMISRMKDEPDWMREFRHKALDVFLSKPMPTWGNTELLNSIDFDNIFYYIKPIENQKNNWDDVPENIKNTFEKLGIPEAEQKFLAGVSAQYESEVVYHSFKEDLEKQGVIFLDMDSGLKKHPDIVKKYLATVIPVADNKFAALNSAVWSGGSFIYVPPGLDVKIPLQAYFRINAENMGQFERTLIIADKGSRVHYIEGCTAPVYTTDSLHSAVVELIALDDAYIRYTTIQNWSHNLFNLVTKRAVAHKNATVEWVDGNIGSKLTMKYPCVYLVGEGAKGEILSVAFANDGQHQDAGAKVIHAAPNTSSRVTSKSISKGSGRASYRGLVKVHKNAVGSKVSVECDALLIGGASRTDTYPTMEIDADQVRVEHEARVSKVAEEQLFYLTSRGLSEDEARLMIINGFIEPFTKELPMEYAVELNRLIELEMEGSVG